MKILFENIKSLLLVPETEFEQDVLSEMFPVTKTEHPHIAYIKTGHDLAHVIGLKIVSAKKRNN